MVILDDTWKLDSGCKIESISLEHFDEIEKYIKERGKEFTDEKRQQVENGEIDEDNFLRERDARKCLLNIFIHYERICKRDISNFKGNNYLLLSNLWDKIRDELNVAINKVFSLEINGKKLKKRKGESIKHYLMRYIILNYLNKEYGVKDFQEEYSKIKEVLESLAKGKKEWEKMAKRADLYVILNNGLKLWIEVEKAVSNRELRDKLKRANTMLNNFPDLFDKIVYVFSNHIYFMAEATLVEARKIGFPENKIEFYQIDFENNKIYKLLNPKLTEVEFGNRLLDLIANGYEPENKTAREAAHIIKENIIIPLVNKEWDTNFVIYKKEKIKRLISFWKKYTRILRFGKLSDIEKSKKEVEFKKYALVKIKQNYPFLFK